jgi:hypothetical protein
MSTIPTIVMWIEGDPVTEVPDFVEQAIIKVTGKGRHDNPPDLVITVAPYIYTKKPLSQDLLVHECQHFHQQGSGLDEEKMKEWWRKYPEDDKFRYAQELEAYRVQHKFIADRYDRNTSTTFAKNLAHVLTSGLYGKGFSYAQAFFDIMAKKK